MSRLFGRTLRDDPSEATLPSHRLLLRAGCVRLLGSGIYSVLPLGWRTLRRVEQIIREEMDRLGAQEMEMPVVHPSDVWEKTGRFFSVGNELVRFKDRGGRDMVLAFTHEEVATDLAAWFTSSYRQLPFSIYQFQTKFRDEPRPRGGLLRVREFTMKDAYSFHADAADLDAFYPSMVNAYVRTFRRVGIEPVVVESDTGVMGGSQAHEFHLMTSAGEDTIVACPQRDYAANLEVAVARKAVYDHGPPLAVAKVATPGQETIQAVAAYLGIPTHQTLKAVFYWTGRGIAFAAIRGDLEVNEAKLRRLLKAPNLRLAADQELATAGLVAGYASPIGLRHVTLVVDDSVPQASNLVAGANEPGFHLTNVNFPRDFTADLVGDIASVRAGDACVVDGAPLALRAGIEIGNTFKLGSYYAEKIGGAFLGVDGIARPLVMGSYGIGLGRLVAAIVERHHDEKGICWPVSVAPYDVHLVALGVGDISTDGEALASELEATGLSVLLDDREESAGVKFNDADLLGIPLRLTVSRRTLASGDVELKLRTADDRRHAPRAEVVAEVERLHAALQARLDPARPGAP
ncbi:MAG: proline--tRNA ligase [Actinobacteria bacterium]|nr:proline--tRNA ligase [Actinomycetota bacterium]